MMNVSNGDARIAVETHGHGDHTIVLLHGFPLTEHARVVTMDLRGMGASSVVDGPYLMETLAGDVAAVLDVLGVERATLVGHSLGGYVALAFARMYIERLQRLALVCSRVDADTPDRARHRFELADDAEQTGSSARIVAEMQTAVIGATTRRKHPEILEKFEKIARCNDPRGLAAMLRGMALRDSARDIAGDLTMPVLVVRGAEDQGVPAAEAQAMAASFSGATSLVTIPDSGHAPMLEQPQILSACLVDFATGTGVIGG